MRGVFESDTVWIRLGLLQVAMLAAIAIVLRSIHGPFEVTLRIHSPLAAETLFASSIVLYQIARSRDGAAMR